MFGPLISRGPGTAAIKPVTLKLCLMMLGRVAHCTATTPKEYDWAIVPEKGFILDVSTGG